MWWVLHASTTLGMSRCSTEMRCRLQWFCYVDPATGEERAKPLQRMLLRPGAGEQAAAFLQWYVLEGHPGHPRVRMSASCWHLQQQAQRGPQHTQSLPPQL